MKERGLPIIPEIEGYLVGAGESLGHRQRDHKSLPKKDGEVGEYPGHLPSIFVFHINGKPYSRHIRERRWNAAMRGAVQKYSTRPMTLRDLRSSATSRWLKRGMLIQDAAQLLGNSPEIIRKHYSDQVENKVVEIMGGKG